MDLAGMLRISSHYREMQTEPQSPHTWGPPLVTKAENGIDKDVEEPDPTYTISKMLQKILWTSLK